MSTIPDLPEDASEYHVLGRVDDPESIARRVVEEAVPGAVVIDMSAGQLITPSTLYQKLSKEGIIREDIYWVNGQDFADQFGESSRRTYVKWLAKMSDKPLVDGKSIKELFTYKRKVALWWFTSMAVKHPIGHPYRWIFYSMAVINEISQRCELNKVHLWIKNDRMSDVLESCLPEDTILYVHSTYEGKRSLLAAAKNRLYSSLFGRIGRNIYSFLQATTKIVQNAIEFKLALSSARQTPSLKQAEGRKPTLLVRTSFPRSWTDSGSGYQFDPEVNYYDHYFGSSPWRLSKEGFEVGWMPGMSGRENVNKWKEIRKDQALPDVAEASASVSWTMLFNLVWAALKSTLRYTWYFEIRKLHKSWLYGETNLGAWLKEDMRRTLIHGYPEIIWRFEQYRAVAETCNPDVVLYRDEFYKSGRIIASALKGKTMLVGVQHGLIGNEHTVYHFHPSQLPDATCENTDLVHHNPVPDYFASFGSSFKELFRNWEGYPSHRVWSIGGLRHDELLERYKHISEEEKNGIKEDLNLPLDRPVVLLCTGGADTVSAWSKWVMEATKNWSKPPHIAVKIHQYHGDPAQVHEVAEYLNYSEYSVHTDHVYPLIVTSNVLIGGGSTVIWEAALMKTPAIALSPASDYQHYPFDDLEGCVLASNIEELKIALGKTLYSKNIVSISNAESTEPAAMALARKLRTALK